MVAVLESDPDLGHYLTEEERSKAASAALAPVLTVDKGPVASLADELGGGSHLGLLVLEGVLVRHVSFGQIGSNEFLGPGDLLRPWGRIRAGDREIMSIRWEAVAPARLAVLDRQFANRIRGWPEITVSLLDRTTERSDSQSLQAALQQAKTVEDRVLLALWHFAGRWGETKPEGRLITLANITGEILASYVGARRQAVSTALGQLADRGAIKRLADRSILLPHRPPQLRHIQPGRRATDNELSLRDRER